MSNFGQILTFEQLKKNLTLTIYIKILNFFRKNKVLIEQNKNEKKKF